jgi:tRNA(Ile)-lysidine synthase
MLSTMLRTIAAHGLFEAGDRVVVAVSGGPDSMALLHALWELRDRLKVSLEVAGVDHGLRPEAAVELATVRARAEDRGLPFAALAVDVQAARRRSGGLQDAARRVRLEALERFAAARGARRVALGHQADDQAETVLFRIVRGTGLAGLAGIPYQRGPFVRPLLDVRRSEILRYLRRRSIPFAADPSNADPRFARARVRHRLLPALAEENPRIVPALLALADAARRGAAAPPDVVPELVPGLARGAAAAVRRLRVRGGTGAVDVAGGKRVEVSYGEVRVHERDAPQGGAPAPVTIAGPGDYGWPGGRLEIRIDDPEVPPEQAFDADRLCWPLVARARRPGDRMRPRGGRGSRKLSDLMIDAKLPRRARDALPVVATADDQVLFAPGLRPAELARATASTRRRLHIAFTLLPRLASPPGEP